MRLADSLHFVLNALRAHRLRTGLTLLGMSVGIAAVISLTALAEGARLYVMQEFLDLGSDLLIVLPGRIETSGVLPWGGVTHDLTLSDFEALRQRLPDVKHAAPAVIATEAVQAQGRSRSVAIIGTTAEYARLRVLTAGTGRFLTEGDPKAGGMEIVLGVKVASALFPGENPLGRPVRIGGWRFRVVGVLEPKGRSMGFDMDDLALIPVQTAMKVFNRSSLFRILIRAQPGSSLTVMKGRVLTFFRDRHRAEDVTVLAQDAMVSAFSSVMRVLTLALAGIAAISLIVAGIGIMNIMLISVSERREEIGLVRALGGLRRQVLRLFLAEAVLLSSLGGVLGLGVGYAAVWVFVRLYPGFPASPPGWAVWASLLLSLLVGTLFGLLPALRATRLDPILALSRR